MQKQHTDGLVQAEREEDAMRDPRAEEKAAERLKIISSLVTRGMDKDAKVALRHEIAESSGVSDRTLRRWVDAYEEKGFEGLKPEVPGRPAERTISTDVLSEAIALRTEVPSRSVKTIIQILEFEGVVEKGTLKRSTLQDAFERAGYSKEQMRTYAAQKTSPNARRFQREHRNELWQSDIKYALMIGGVQTYIVTYIDDATRFITHTQIYDSQGQAAVADCFMQAVRKWGCPDRTYYDNGKVFVSRYMQRACSVLGIRLLRCAPYAAESKGKVERFNRTCDAFLAELDVEKVHTVEEANVFYQAWIEECYQNSPHSGIDGRTPAEAFQADPAPLRIASSEDMASAFVYSENRKVDRAGCISFQGRLYEIDLGVHMAGKTVEVLYDPKDTSEVTVVCEGMPPQKSRPLVVTPHAAKKPKLPVPPKPAPPAGSRLLKALAEEREKKTREQHEVISYTKINGENS